MPRQFEEFIPSELNPFEKRPLIISVEESVTLEVNPLNSVEGATSLEFISLAYSDKFKDLSNVYLKLKLQLLKKNDQKYASSDTVQPHLVSNALHSIFKSAYVTLNGNNLRNMENNYHYTQYIETTLNYSHETAKARLSTQHYVQDGVAADLKALAANSVQFDVMGKINLLNLSKLLVPGVSVQIRFNLESDNFFIQETTANSKLKILDATLYIRHVIPKESVLLSIERTLASGKNAIYEYKRGDIYTQTLPANISTLNIPNFYSGPKPSLVLLCFVENAAYVGDRTKNPFEFKHFDLTSFNFLINSTAKPVNPYKIKITDDEKCYSQIFNKVYESIGLNQSSNSVAVNRSNFASSMFYLMEDLTSNNTALDDVTEPMESCTLGVNGTFAKPLPTSVTCILYMMIQGRFDVNANRQVSVVY